MLIILNTAIGYSYIYYTDTKEKHRIISEFGIKYFIDDYNAVIHHIDLNYMDCKAYRLNCGYKDETLTEPLW